MSASISFTQEQSRAILGLKPETLRHWRKLVPYLAQKSGKTARFSFTDLICLAATRQMTETLGMSISCVHQAVESLFQMMSIAEVQMLQGTVVLIGASAASFVSEGETLNSLAAEPTVLIPLAPLIERLQSQVLPGMRFAPQPFLPFSPQAVTQA